MAYSVRNEVKKRQGGYSVRDALNQKKQEEEQVTRDNALGQFLEGLKRKEESAGSALSSPATVREKETVAPLSGGKKFVPTDVVGKYQATHGDNAILSQDPRYKMRFTNVELEQQKREAADDAIDELLGRQQAAQREMEFFDSGEFKGPQYLAAEQIYNQIQQQIAEENRKAMSQQQIDEIKAFQEMERWQSATGRKGFADAAKYQKNDDLQYNVINRDPDAVAKSHEEAAKYNWDIAGVDMGHLEQMTDEEIGLYNYYYSTVGKEKADEYLASIESDLKARRMGDRRDWYREYAEKNPVAASAFSVLTSPVRGLSYVGQAADYLKNGKMDANESYNIFTRAGSDIRGQVSSDIEKNVEGFWGKAGSFAYNTGMSMGDFLMAAGLSGGVGGIATTIMGTGAAAQTVLDAKDRGLNDDQAFALGTIAGFAEAATEKFSIEALLDRAAMGKGALTYILKNAITEGSEEAASGIINTVADVLISKDKSEWAQSVEDYKTQGMSEKEAFWRAVADQAKSIGLDALGGMLSGGLIGSVGAIGNTAAQQAARPKKGAEVATEMGLGKHGAEAAEKAGITPENVGAFTAYWRAGAEGRPIEAVTTNQTGIDELTKEQAYLSGKMDATEEGVAVREWTTYNKEQEAERNGTGENALREGGERYDGENPVQPVRQLEEGTGRDQGRNVQNGQTESRVVDLEYSAEKVNSKQAGLEDGLEDDGIYLIKGGTSQDYLDAEAEAKRLGLEFVPFAGGDIHTLDAPEGARGCVVNGKMYVRMDDPEFTGRQIALHEGGHELIRQGVIDVDQVLGAVARKMGDSFVADLTYKYLRAYAGTTMTNEQIQQEIVCDARGEMNIFRVYGEIAQNSIDLADKVLPAIREEAANGGGTRAGPDGAQYSRRYDYPKLNQKEWDLLNHSLSSDISKADGYVDKATKWLYKNEKGVSVFSIYGIGDGTDPTPLYASGGKKAETDNAAMQEYLEGKKNAVKGKRTLDRVLADLKGKRTDKGDVVHYDAKRGSDAADVRVPVRERAGDGRADSGRSEANQQAVSQVGVELDENTESAAPGAYSRRTWLKSQYATDKAAAAKALSQQLDVSLDQAERYIDNVNSVAKIIADDEVRLDYEAAPGMSSFVGNTEYGGSIDFSTICKKRRLLTGTFEAIQKALPNTALTAEEILTIRKMMADRGYEVSCGLCYVEGSRANMGQYTKQFLDEYAKTNHKYLPNMAEMNTASGQEKIRIQHPEVYAAYEKFMNSLAQRKPKMYQMATEYQGEILKKFKGKKNVAEKNKNGGLRLQSFSDFEISHLIDSMQVIMDMSQVGLAGQAYTKVPDFAAALGNTGLKINLSLIAKGVDAKGNLVLDEVEGMARADAEKLRNQYSDNVGTVIVVFTDVQLQAAMNDPFIDYIIPFHRSQWNSQQHELMGLPKNAKDFTSWQNESYIEPVYSKSGKKQRPSNYMPNEYWDFGKSGAENAKTYLQMCHENNRRPKFHYLLDKNADGSYSLKKDGSTDGYWKLLIDFKMYNNEGVGVEQMPVKPEFNMTEAERMLRDYQGGHETFPAARDVVDEFVEGYKKQNPRANYSRRLDSDYMKAVQNGDMETAQRMVDEAAEAAGYIPVYRYHQTGQRFNEFSNKNPQAGLNDSDTPNGYFFKENDHDIGVGADFVKTGHGGSIQMKVFLKHRNMLRFENRAAAQKWYAQNVPGYAAALAKYEKHLEDFDTISRETNDKMFDELNELDKSGNSTPERDLEIIEKYDKILDDWIAENESYSTGLRAEMRKLLNQYFIENDSGYDGIELVDDGHRYIDMKREDVHTFIVFQKSQIKSADPVTYDDNGDVIPLSKRFDPNEVDIRLSRRLNPEDVRAALDVYREQYGVIEPGENPFREIQMPRKTGENENVSKTVRTILEAKATPETAIPTIEQMVANGDFSYETITDKQAIADAQGKLTTKGWSKTLSKWLDEAKNGTVSKDHTVTGWALYNNAANAGDLDTAMTILEKMVLSQRNAAQALQATRVLKKLSPEAQLYAAQRSVEDLQEELNERYGAKNAPEIKIDPTLAEAFMTAKTEKARDSAMAEIYKDVGKQMPSTFRDKWNAWRYLAMLGNPRTHVRNIVGNAGFAPIVATKNLTATAIEKAVNAVTGGKTGRSKAVIGTGAKDKALLSAAWADYDNVQGEIMAGGKYSDFQVARQNIEEGRRIFKNRVLEAARRGNSRAMEAEDAWFSKPHYAYALAGYCKANGITPEMVTDGKAIQTARAYAIREAQKATYRDTNAFSQMISDLGKVNKTEKNVAKKGLGIVLQGILPFRKTPANILVRGVEYSPIGLVKTIALDSAKVKRGDMTATEMIDNLSAGLTGTGLLALGAFLAAQGLIRGHGPEDDKKEFEELQGHQAYSLEVGGTSITLDWLAPECLPFFVGVNLYEQSQATGEELTMSTILSAITNVSEPMLEMSCLQSLNDVFDAVGYASSNDLSALPSILASAATSYLTQALPTIFGQAERTGQDIRYTTYTKKDAFLTRDMQYAIGSASARIPGWDYNQIPYVDAWGRREDTGGLAARAFGNFANPSYTSTITGSEMEDELMRVYDETGEASVFPTRAQRSFPVDGEQHYLTADEYVRYATTKGETSYNLVSELVDMRIYDRMSEEEKVDAISDAYSLANVVAKYEVSDYETTGWMAKAVAAKKIGVDYSKYLEVRLTVKDIESIKDSDGDAISNSKGLQVMEAIYKIPGLNDKQRRQLFEDFGVGKSIIDLNKAAVEAKLKNMR